jgi:hypothetical protein
LNTLIFLMHGIKKYAFNLFFSYILPVIIILRIHFQYIKKDIKGWMRTKGKPLFTKKGDV